MRILSLAIKKSQLTVDTHITAPQAYSGTSPLPSHLSKTVSFIYVLSCRWCGKGGFAQRKCTMDDALPQWFDALFPPLAIYYGGRDYLVATEPLLERIEKREEHIRLLRVLKVEDSEVRRSCRF